MFYADLLRHKIIYLIYVISGNNLPVATLIVLHLVSDLLLLPFDAEIICAARFI